MDGKYFKARKTFRRKENKYDLGSFIGVRRTHLDRFFLNELRTIPENDLLGLYDWHSINYGNISGDPEKGKKEFMEECVKLLEYELNREEMENAYKMSRKQKRNSELMKSRYDKLLSLLEDKRDKWGVMPKNSETVRVKELRAEKNELKSKLSKYSIKPQHKIQIMSDDISVFINLLHQMQNLEHWEENGKGLLISHSQNTWAKILSNYFSLNGEDIPFNTAKKYFGSYSSPKIDDKKEYEIKVLKK